MLFIQRSFRTLFRRILFSPLFLLSLLFLFATPLHTHAESVATNTESPTSDTSTTTSDQINANGTATFGEKKVYLREPFFEGQKSIDVSPDTSGGAIGIMSQYITMLYKYILAFGSIVAVLVIMFGGIKMMTSGGDSGATSESKEMIIRTLSGLALLFLTGLFLYTVNPNFYIFGGESSNSTISNNSGAVSQ